MPDNRRHQVAPIGLCHDIIERQPTLIAQFAVMSHQFDDGSQRMVICQQSLGTGRCF